MKITCCNNCENRHEKCHGHCEEYLTQKILKIMVEAETIKDRDIRNGIYCERNRQINKLMHDRHIRRVK
jgi:hypothetical protein